MMTHLLEMANNLCGVHQMSRLPEEWADPGRDDDGFDLTVLACWTSEH